MKFKFYLLPLLLFLFTRSSAQDCTTLTVSCTPFESRCVATGSIEVTVTGGSGSYTYKAVGPVSTSVTSSSNITGLPRGYYSIIVKDLVSACIKQVDSVFVPGNYSDPRFQLSKTDVSCIGNDGTIAVINQQNGRGPFTYTIISPSPSSVGASNISGSFSGLIPGEYYVQLSDSCGGIQVRRITIADYNWWINALTVVRVGCDSVHVSVELRDNSGNWNTSGTAFDGFSYGYIMNGDTTWFTTRSFSAFIGTHRNITILVKDNCGHIQSEIWFIPDSVKPSLNPVALTNPACSTFTAGISGQNLTNPNYCLYDTASNLISCNSTGSFPGLAYGPYCIKVTNQCYDTVMTTCFSLLKPAPSVNSTVAISNQTCADFTATITGQANLFAPDYCLYDSSGVLIICNNTGVFTHLPYANYCIRVHDACTDSIITRCFSAVKPSPVLTAYSISSGSCSTFNVSVTGTGLNSADYCLYDSLGNVVSCDSTGIFNGIPNGHYCIRAISCTDTSNSICFARTAPAPSIGPSVTITNKTCTGFTATITGQTNLTTPYYCLYDQNDSLLTCDSTGIFTDIPYGSYCIKVHNSCVDTVITRCFSQFHAIPTANSILQLLSSSCTTVSFQASGTNLTSPDYCLKDSANNVLECNSTGVFNNYPYGHYCVTIHDGCIDTTMSVCQSFTPVRGFSLATTKSCAIGMAWITINFSNNNAPYRIKINHPNGSTVVDTITSANPYQVEVPGLPSGTQYKVIGTDNCGNRDSSLITPDPNIVTKNTNIRAKCPSAAWLNGSGDILAYSSSNTYALSPQIIKKNGAAFSIGYSSVSANVYTFSDLEPAQYIVQYTQSICGGTIYDTITIPPYTYPSQGQSAIYQCDNNSFSLGADVSGGVSPYTYQIIGSLPDSPVINTPAQANPVFNINNGVTYSLVRLRSIDACGNATLNDVSVLPLQNISISASSTCFYQNILLSVDTIPNAQYFWYLKTTPTDSVFLDSGLTYDLPFFVPEQTGQYICKVVVNEGCVTRLSYFNLDGDCGHSELPLALSLTGKKSGLGNQLSWTNNNEGLLSFYVMERKRPGDESYIPIARIRRHEGSYLLNDNDPGNGVNLYRLKMVYPSRNTYSNIVSLSGVKDWIRIYPNPVKDQLHINLTATKLTCYKIELLTSGGQVIYTTSVRITNSSTLDYTRNKNMDPGVYLLRITDTDANTTEIRKLLFE